MLIGEAGSGKSNTLERVILPVFSRTKVIAAGQTTAFTLMKDSASSNVIPQALDEFKPSKLDKYRLDAIFNHFRNSYDCHEGIRGRADQTTVRYELLAPLVVAGEESADEAAVRERSVELLFSKKDIKPAEYRVNFARLCEQTRSCLHGLLIIWRVALLGCALSKSCACLLTYPGRRCFRLAGKPAGSIWSMRQKSICLTAIQVIKAWSSRHLR
jgi:hypothetical protein